MKVGGTALLSFHPASLFDNLSRYYANRQGVAADYFDGTLEHNPFYDKTDDIIKDLTQVGSADVKVELISDRIDQWWEVTAKKPGEPTA